MSSVEDTTLKHDGATYVLAEAPRGKKVEQVAKMIEILQKDPGIPMEFEDLCLKVGQKYPQDVQAAMIALEMTEHITRYQKSNEVGHRARSYYAWESPANPS